MMLPAREVPEEDRSRTGLESAAATPTEAPPAASGRGADAGSAAQSDKTAQADSAVRTDGAVQPDSAAQPDRPVQAGGPVQADGAVQADSAVRTEGAVQADPGMVAFDSPPASAVSPEPGSSALGDSVDMAPGQEWHQVLAMFVDDPRGSVAEASVMVDEAINAFIAAARGRQASLAASWQAQDTDTEQLRMALRDYRTLWTSMTQLA